MLVLRPNGQMSSIHSAPSPFLSVIILGEIAKMTTEAGLCGCSAFGLSLCFTKSLGFVASVDSFLCVHFFFFSNLLPCVVSTQDDYFKSWAPAKSLDRGESCCRLLSLSSPSLTAAESYICMFYVCFPSTITPLKHSNGSTGASWLR